MGVVALSPSGWALEASERAALVPAHISTRFELAAWEQANIVKALAWLDQRPRRGSVLTGRFLRSLHRRMFDETWDHAGHYRRGKSPAGVPAWTISTRVEDIIARTRGWIQAQSYPADEIAIRYHHRLSEVRPFERGNGRVTRLAADALAMELGQEAFTWGALGSLDAAELSERYRVALRVADNDNISLLLEFARS
ncbi:MAG TPA: mobile mystery protein B [Gemmatimonadaceae bacterium]|nr:mobile mystery protein B [Gemmatimonadaceae bacterium]